MSAPAFDPPAGPPPPSSLCLPCIAAEDGRRFHVRGWAPLDLSASDIAGVQSTEFVDAFSSLFAASSSFFRSPLAYKNLFIVEGQGSEDGFSRVEGEKELLTVRTARTAPPDVRENVERCWALCGTIVTDVITRISKNLQLDPRALQDLVEPCCLLPSGDDRVATLLRLFRYERGAGRPLVDESNASNTSRRIVAENHRDLGLLSIVIGSSPGLEVWDPYNNSWVAVEAAEEHLNRTRLTATLLSGETLARLTNRRYQPGGHRVVVSDMKSMPYRFSIVFALRAHHSVLIDTTRLTTTVTGKFSRPYTNMNAGQLYQQISNMHFNINADLQERRKQEEKLAAARQQAIASKQ